MFSSRLCCCSCPCSYDLLCAPVDCNSHTAVRTGMLEKHKTLVHSRYNRQLWFIAISSPAHRARMHSLCCRHAGAYLDTIPVSYYLDLADADVICSSQFRLGATGTNPSIPATTCYCSPHVQGSDNDHAMTCPKLSGSRRHTTLRMPSAFLLPFLLGTLCLAFGSPVLHQAQLVLQRDAMARNA